MSVSQQDKQEKEMKRLDAELAKGTGRLQNYIDDINSRMKSLEDEMQDENMEERDAVGSELGKTGFDNSLGEIDNSQTGEGDDGVIIGEKSSRLISSKVMSEVQLKKSETALQTHKKDSEPRVDLSES